MKYLFLLLIFISCDQPKYKHIGQDIINGKVSATKEGHIGRGSELPTIWVQSSTETQAVRIPFEYENTWKVGDTCLLIIEKYEVVKDEK